jgi:hypothetical protein
LLCLDVVAYIQISSKVAIVIKGDPNRLSVTGIDPGLKQGGRRIASLPSAARCTRVVSLSRDLSRCTYVRSRFHAYERIHWLKRGASEIAAPPPIPLALGIWFEGKDRGGS